MKRNKFVASLITMLALPAFAFKKIHNSINGLGKGFKVKAGEGKTHGHMKLKGVNANVLDLKISGSDTNGGLAIFEQTSLSQGKGTPLHVHPLQDEVFHVIEGSYYFKVGEETFDLSVGETIFLPKNIPHAWTQVSERGKMIVTFQPAGKMEEFFVTVAGLDHEPTPAEMAQIFSDHELKVVGAPLPLKK